MIRRITVDLTPMKPGGDNGGAKLVALSLVRELASLAPDTEFVLLTSAPNHDELAALDRPNVRRQRVDVEHVPTLEDAPSLARARTAARVLVDTLLPTVARSRVKDDVWRFVKRRRRGQVASAATASTDLHFAPYTAPFFHDARVPLVSLVHDVQFFDYPEFFDEQQRRDRRQHFEDACARADRLICVSDFVRTAVLANSDRQPQTVQTIYSAVLHATKALGDPAATARSALSRLEITRPRFLLYPANAWPHKNHRRLLEAFASYLARHPESDLAMVWTGAPSDAFDELVQLAQNRLPAGTFAYAGFTSESEFGALLRACRALIFPSLYEGFGLPVLEAMACERPVLCSNVTSLPEVAGDAALLFDPCEPDAIAAAIDRLESDPALETALVERGRTRVRQFGSARDMAARYLASFDEVVAARQRSQRR